MNDLQQAMDAIPPGECYVIMGDLNVHVGSRLSEGDQWTGEMNDAERELLTFLATNKATLCSTWFQKVKFISTLQHPKTEQWHCFDFSFVRQIDVEDDARMHA